MGQDTPQSFTLVASTLAETTAHLAGLVELPRIAGAGTGGVQAA